MSQLTSAPEGLSGGAPIAVRVVDVETMDVGIRLGASTSGDSYRRALVLVRERGVPLGWASLQVADDGYVSLAALQPQSTMHPKRDTDGDGRGLDAQTFASSSGRTSDAMFSVVVATCANPESTVRCVRSILISASDNYEVVVVENRPGTSAVRDALRRAFGEDHGIRYIEERRAGLANARNAGLRVAQGEFVAFTDDDVTVDPGWISALRRAFAREEVDCVTGLIAPCEFESSTQILVERFASYGKGFEPRVYSIERPPADQPLFPYTAGHFASGANMAFRAASLREVDGFDPLLGTGTPARGCEDLDICIRMLNSGMRIAYEPAAIIWHRHPDSLAGLRRRVFDYGAALGAMLTKHIVTSTDRWTILARAPRGAVYFLDPRTRKNAARGAGFPTALKWLELAGLFYGPFAYLTSRLQGS